MTPEHFAAAYEKARYESMLSRRWEDLRETERQTRTSVALEALTAAGLADVLRAAHETATRAEVFEGLLAQRDAEIARLRAEHAQELERVRNEHESQVDRRRALRDGPLPASGDRRAPETAVA